jgi:surfeit locus 1 family protein
MLFRPSFALTVILVALAGTFLYLGLWQLERKAQKADLFERFANAPSMGIEQALTERSDLARIDAFGRYDPERHILLDNRIWNGRAGVHALTPFELTDGRVLLVNRGWLPLRPDRRSLPAVPTDGGARTIRGRLVLPIAPGARLGDADRLRSDHWPQLVTYLDLDDVGAVLGRPLQPWLVQLDPGDSSGFGDREWLPAVMAPSVHGAYAIQWMALSVATLIIWVTLGLRRGQKNAAYRATNRAGAVTEEPEE